MGKSYSTDLRDRVSGFVAAGHSRREATRHFGISASSAVRVVQGKAAVRPRRRVRAVRRAGAGWEPVCRS